MSHKHLPTSHPLYALWPAHNMPKAQCDALWTAYLHGHEGQPCVKEVKPGNKIATCTLIGAEKRKDHSDESLRRETAFKDFIAHEERRKAALLREVH